MKAMIFFVVLGIVLCHIPSGASESPEVQAAVKGNTEFAFDLYARLRDREGNIFFSPYSISSALAMTYAGAKGSTAEQMASVLHFALETDNVHSAFSDIHRVLDGGEKKRAYELHIANALWMQKDYPLRREFTDLLGKYYRAGLMESDFAGNAEKSRKEINAWVEEKTREKITELIGPGVLNALTRLVLTNAIYFKGMWANQFKKELTKPAPFTLLDGKKTEVAMMHQNGKFAYSETDKLQVLEMPYEGNEISMLVLLPKETDGLKHLETLLTAENLNQWFPKMKREVMVWVPKFRMTSQFMLAEVLQSLGMTEAFLPSADFSGMTGQKDLFISAVIHKAFVDVNEEGTEAAAATAVIMARSASIQHIPVFRADHPFIFMIRDNASGSILFVGRVMNPDSQK